MTRPLRIEYPGAVYHIASHRNEKKAIFKDDQDRENFLITLQRVNKRYNWLCHAYCLMTNHYHLLIETPDGNLSLGMRQPNGVYTQLFNKRHKRNGHLFQVFIVLALLLAPALCAADERTATASVHAGFLYPNGVDLAGYTVEQGISDTVYYFYTFGFPSLAAAGLSYYADYERNGLSCAIGVGIGSVLYASLVYQWKIADRQYLKTGAGFTTGVAYTGAYPALSYEYRF